MHQANVSELPCSEGEKEKCVWEIISSVVPEIRFCANMLLRLVQKKMVQI